MKRYELDEEVKGLTFWPLEDLQAAFAAVETDAQEGGELYALRRFHRRMQYFEKTAGGEVDIELGEEAVAYAYERPRLDADIARMEGRIPSACPGCPFTMTCEHKELGL